VIREVGKDGMALSTGLEAAVAQEVGISTRTVHRAVLEGVQAGLLEGEQVTTLEGRPPQGYSLTAKGRWLYQELTGGAPTSLDRLQLLKAHKSDRHLALILKTAERFHALGFEVDRQPLRIEIEPNRFFQPDLVAKRDGETFYLEVESSDQERPGLYQKWVNALAGGGRICVVTANLNGLRMIQGNIAHWSYLEEHSLTLYITCLPVLKMRKSGESPWYAVKEYQRG